MMCPEASAQAVTFRTHLCESRRGNTRKAEGESGHMPRADRALRSIAQYTATRARRPGGWGMRRPFVTVSNAKLEQPSDRSSAYD